MRTFVARVLAVVGTVIVWLMLGSGLASAADPYVGKTYADAAAAISKRNGTAVVATVSGSALAQDDCIVISWAKSNFLDSSGDQRRGEYRLNLNCNNPVATPGHPGNSSTSPAGIKAKVEQKRAASYDKNPAWCHKSENNLKYCIGVCERTGLCEIEA